MNLKEEINKNIQFVFDNEESFINEFVKTKSAENIEIIYFYMGSDQHIVKISSFYHLQGFSQEMVIKIDEFESWKSTIK